MKIKYTGSAAYQEFDLTKTNALWQPGQSSDVIGNRLSLLLASGKFVDEEVSQDEFLVTGKNNPVTGGIIKTIALVTQAEYDAIAVPDNSTLYVIV